MQSDLDKSKYPGGNPPAVMAAEPHSDSGGAHPSRSVSPAPAVDHLAAGGSQKASSETNPDILGGRVSPESVSSRLEVMQIDTATEDVMSTGSTVETVDSDTERKLLGETGKAEKEEGKRIKKLDRASKAKRGYKNAIKYLEKMKKKNPDELSDKEREYVRRNKKVVERYEK